MGLAEVKVSKNNKILASLAQYIAGKPGHDVDKLIEKARGIFALSGVTKGSISESIIKSVISSPGTLRLITKIKSLLDEKNSRVVLQTAEKVLLSDSSEDTHKIIGIISVGLVHRHFPLTGDEKLRFGKKLKELSNSESEDVRDSAIVILDFLGFNQQGIEEATKRLEDKGIPISDAVKE